MTGIDTILLIAAGICLLAGWGLLVLYFWLTRTDQPITIINQSECRGYCCERTAADRLLNPRNT